MDNFLSSVYCEELPKFGYCLELGVAGSHGVIDVASHIQRRIHVCTDVACTRRGKNFCISHRHSPAGCAINVLRAAKNDKILSLIH